ncbi:MAG: peptide-methionine (S)-S-oxide reductase [Bacteroidetes bacterium HGW-Bacteroidetes-6]|jgi:peptide-methionine (S)-S-oxide reductase|nr:MAG: peptide-methionine (S)-S-oxide reductase [Bacteroidetes bacterium HGW-Bacteroidetes-6]
MKTRLKILLIFLLTAGLISCSKVQSSSEKRNEEQNAITMDTINTDTATFAAGCFWCVEEQLKQLKGVEKVISGYTGGKLKNPTYNEVCSGLTGHAEACNVIYNPEIITYDELLEAFFQTHDPTQLNRQGNDVGTQYRSAIFYHNEEQKKLAEYYIQKLNEEEAYPSPIVTEVNPYSVFYEAEEYHQDYYENNSQKPYCQMVIKPKLDKFRKVFKEKLKE